LRIAGQRHFGVAGRDGRTADGPLRTDSGPAARATAPRGFGPGGGKARAEPVGGMALTARRGNPAGGERRRSRRTQAAATSQADRRQGLAGQAWRRAGSQQVGAGQEPWRGTKPMEGEGARSPATVGRATDPTAEQGPEVEGRHRQPAPRALGRGWRHNHKRATVLATGCGCWREDFFEGCETRCGNDRGSAHDDRTHDSTERDDGSGRWHAGLVGTTSGFVPGRAGSSPLLRERVSRLKRSEPCSAAGCNKPATLHAEQAVEVVENHEGGT
jgi:hypothetical protein